MWCRALARMEMHQGVIASNRLARSKTVAIHGEHA